MTQLGRKTSFLALPYLSWLVMFLMGPLLFIFVTSFQQKGVWGGVVYTWNFDNYLRAFDGLYIYVLWSSIRLAALTSLSCLLIGYPMAWFMVRCRPAFRNMLLILVMLPFMSNFVVRAYAVKFLIGVEGPLNRFLMGLQFIETPLFLDSPKLAVWFGMVTNYLPFMVLPLYVALERFDTVVLEAARDLGANSWQSWSKIMWPLTRPAVVTGFVLVFIPALGEFVIPDLMGGAKTMYLGNLLAEQFLKARDWPFGAAICIIALGLALVVTAAVKIANRLYLRWRKA